jgi:hypothetical protein
MLAMLGPESKRLVEWANTLEQLARFFKDAQARVSEHVQETKASKEEG